nr:putative reverse transcriptase domain-containing protein [Tanacetum cinerariifolium]
MAFSHVLAAALGKVSATPASIEAWVKLLLLPRCTLRVFRPSNRQERRVVLGKDDRVSGSDSSTVGTNVKQCLRKVSDGHFTAAVKVLCSSGVAPFGTDTLTALLAKHLILPPPVMPGSLPSEPPLVADVDSVLGAMYVIRKQDAESGYFNCLASTESVLGKTEPFQEKFIHQYTNCKVIMVDAIKGVTETMASLANNMNVEKVYKIAEDFKPQNAQQDILSAISMMFGRKLQKIQD